VGAVVASWNLTVEGSDVPGGKVARQNAALFEWSGDAALKFVSSRGFYRATFTLPGLDVNSSYLLDLGKVYFTAAVTVNGRSLPALLAAPYRAGRCVAGEAQFAAMKAMQSYQGWERATEMPRTSLGHLPDTAQ
jgi:hypothetical protein